jgi:hypothetical protein
MSLSKIPGLLDLPHDIIVKIADHFNRKDTINMSRTCKMTRNHLFPMVKKFDSDFNLTLNEEFINRHPLMIIPSCIAYRCCFVIICKNPADCVKKLLAATHGKSGSITLKILDRFDITNMSLMRQVQRIVWFDDVPVTEYQKYLHAICTPPDLLHLEINSTKTGPHDVESFNIDSIKPIVNSRGIRMILRFLFPFASFPRITNNIDYVEILMGTREEIYVQPERLSFINNKRLSIIGMLVMSDTINMEFENVEVVIFDNIMLGHRFRSFNYHRFNNPVSMKLRHRYGIESVVTAKVSNTSEGFFAND